MNLEKVEIKKTIPSVLGPQDTVFTFTSEEGKSNEENYANALKAVDSLTELHQKKHLSDDAKRILANHESGVAGISAEEVEKYQGIVKDYEAAVKVQPANITAAGQ